MREYHTARQRRERSSSSSTAAAPQSRTCLTRRSAPLSVALARPAASTRVYIPDRRMGPPANILSRRQPAYHRRFRRSSTSSAASIDGASNPRPTIRRHQNPNYGPTGGTRGCGDVFLFLSSLSLSLPQLSAPPAVDSGNDGQ